MKKTKDEFPSEYRSKLDAIEKGELDMYFVKENEGNGEYIVER